MNESPEISERFYRIGKVEVPTNASGLNPEWEVLTSLEQAMDYRISLIAENDRFADLGSAKTFQELPVLDKEQFSGFIDRFGYSPELTTIRRLGKNQFVFVSQVGSLLLLKVSNTMILKKTWILLIRQIE